MNLKEISKKLVKYLRHYSREADEDGYVNFNFLQKQPEFSKLTIDNCKKIVEEGEKSKSRLKWKEDSKGNFYIRANQGHSISHIKQEKLLKKVNSYNDIKDCMHGTYISNMKLILKYGLKKMSRNNIHMTNSMISKSGIRKNCEVLIYIDTIKAIKQNINFYISDNGVILSPGPIPSKYFKYIVFKNDINKKYTVNEFKNLFIDKKFIKYDEGFCKLFFYLKKIE